MKMEIGNYTEYSKKKRMYRIVNNTHSNDFNNEPERIAIPYTIWGEKQTNSENDVYVVTRAGWDSKKQRHLINKADFFRTKEEAEKQILEEFKL